MSLPPVSSQNLPGYIPVGEDDKDESAGNDAESSGHDEGEQGASRASSPPPITNRDVLAFIAARDAAAQRGSSDSQGKTSTSTDSSQAKSAPASSDKSSSDNSGGVLGWLHHAASDVSSAVHGAADQVADQVSSAADGAEKVASDLSSGLKNTAQQVAGSVSSAAKSAEKVAGDVASGVKGAAQQVASAVSSAAKDAGQAIVDAKRASDDAVNKVGGAIDSAVHSAEDQVDGVRSWLSENGGVAGKAASAVLGFDEGLVNSGYEMGKGLVQMGYGAAQLANPLEWAANPEANMERLKTVGDAVEGMSKLAALADPEAWLKNPQANAQTASALWHSASESFEKDPSKFLGNAVGTVASFFIPGAGEAGAAADAARAAELAGDAGKAAKAATVAGDAGKVAEAGADATKVARSASEAGKATEAGEAAEASKAGEAGATSKDSACTQPGQCFVAGTLIHTARGVIPIEDVTIGEMVLSRSEFGEGDCAYRNVTEKVTFGDKAIFEVQFQTADGNQETIIATPNHPFWVQGVGWRALELIDVGQKFQLGNGEEARVISVRDLGRKERVFNFTVDDFHTYYVGQSCVWVHNTNCTEQQIEAHKNGGKSSVSTPNTSMRAKANESGSYVDPLSGKETQASGTLAADHIVPKKWIKEQPGFKELTPENQSAILNDHLNTQGLPGPLNASKGAKMPGEWSTFRGQPLDPAYVAKDAQRAAELRQHITDQIQARLEQQAK